MTDLEWAIQQTVHAKRGLSKQLAEVAGTSQQVLLNKVNPEVETNHLTIREGFAIMKHSGCILILETQAAELGYRLVKDEAEAVPVIDAVLAVAKEHGDVAASIQSALADGVIDDNELRNIVTQIREEQHALESLERAVNAKSKGDKA